MPNRGNVEVPVRNNKTFRIFALLALVKNARTMTVLIPYYVLSPQLAKTMWTQATFKSKDFSQCRYLWVLSTCEYLLVVSRESRQLHVNVGSEHNLHGSSWRHGCERLIDVATSSPQQVLRFRAVRNLWKSICMSSTFNFTRGNTACHGEKSRTRILTEVYANTPFAWHTFLFRQIRQLTQTKSQPQLPLPPQVSTWKSVTVNETR